MPRPSKADRAIIKRSKELRELLHYFGLQLRAWDPGVSAVDEEHGSMLQFDSAEWRWLEPILIRLRKVQEGSVANE